MALVPRTALQMVIFMFDADSEGPPRLKSGVTIQKITGVWDTERADPRPRDGINAPKDMPPQTGFWAEGTATVPSTVALDAPGGQLPAEFAAQLDESSLNLITVLESRLASAHKRISALETEVAEKEHMRNTITSLDRHKRDLEETLEKRQVPLIVGAPNGPGR